MIKTPVCELLGIKYPIFQGGMAWIADGRLAASVSDAGGLGIIAAMNAGADYLKEQINIARGITDKPFGVNIMLMSPHADEVSDIVVEEKIPVVLKMELSSDHISRAIAEATGAEVKVFYSCHNISAKQFQNGETYVSLMEKNVETLREALSDGTD